VLGGEDTTINWSEIHESLKDDVAEYLHRQTRRRPLVIPVTLEV
jgi:mRNA degradation ribonuclease J1/J2